MFAENSFYGHARILADYCGVGLWPHQARPIWGYLQHGWAIDPFFGSNFVWGFPSFVWTEGHASAPSTGGRSIHAIGAPFLYFLAQIGQLEQPDDPELNSSIVFPVHGWEGHKTRFSHAEFAQQLVDAGERDADICLYWYDSLDPGIRGAYENRGFRVVSNGLREDPLFLSRFYLNLRRHARVISNQISTAVWYGGAMGREIRLIGPTPGLQFAHIEDAIESHQASLGMARGSVMEGRVSRDIALRELGVGHILPAPELAELLGWSGIRSHIGPTVRSCSGPARRAWAVAHRLRVIPK